MQLVGIIASFLLPEYGKGDMLSVSHKVRQSSKAKAVELPKFWPVSSPWLEKEWLSNSVTVTVFFYSGGGVITCFLLPYIL